MPERFARIAALALVVALIIALPLLVSLFASLQAPAPTRTPTRVAVLTTPPTPPPSPPPTATFTATNVPTVTPVATAGCPNPATPEPFWVDPVLSPTNLLSQKITVTIGRGRQISVADEAGTLQQLGEFSVGQPVTLDVPLAPNTTNNLVVSGKVEYAPNCFYTLQTRVDRNGKPLVIVQTGAPTTGTVSAPTAVTPVVTPSTPGTVYVKPFSQVVGLNADTPNASQTMWLYEANADAPFQVMAQQGAFTRVSSQGGNLNFWTLNENVVTTPAPEPKFENLTEQSVELVAGNIYACEGRAPRGLILGVCQEFQNISTVTVIERVTVENAVLYLVRFNYQTYWVSANVLKQAPQ